MTVKFKEAINRANSAFLYRRYRLARGDAWPLFTAVRQWYRRFLFEWLRKGAGD